MSAAFCADHVRSGANIYIIITAVVIDVVVVVVVVIIIVVVTPRNKHTYRICEIRQCTTLRIVR